MNQKLRLCALVPFLALASSCSSTTEGLKFSAAPNVLDGTWFFSSLPPSLFGVGFASGSLLATAGDETGDTYSFTFVVADNGEPGTTEGCVVAMDQTMVTATVNGTVANGSVTRVYRQGGPACADTAEHQTAVATFSADQTVGRAATLTPYDGDWTVVINGPDDVTNGEFGLTIDQGSWQTTGGVVRASGTVSEAMASATDGTSDLVALKQ